MNQRFNLLFSCCIQKPLSDGTDSSICSTVDYKPPDPLEAKAELEENMENDDPEECFTEGIMVRKQAPLIKFAVDTRLEENC